MQAVSAIIGGGNAAGLVTLDGRIVGDTPAHLALPADGVSYIGIQPDAPRFYGVTRKLRFSGGVLQQCPPDVEAYRWGEGLYEISLRCGELPEPRERRFPFSVARAAFEGAQAVLYYEDGLWLSLERAGRVQTGFLLHPAAEAGALYAANRTLIALAHGERDACLVLNERGVPLGRLEADDIRVEDGKIISVEALGGFRGYEQRSRWHIEDGELRAEDPETGFFSREPNDCAPGIWFLEAVLAGRTEEAMSLFSPSLSVDAAGVAAFLGNYAIVRPHPANPRAAGIAERSDGLIELRTIQFETDGKQILNILEES